MHAPFLSRAVFSASLMAALAALTLSSLALPADSPSTAPSRASSSDKRWVIRTAQPELAKRLLSLFTQLDEEFRSLAGNEHLTPARFSLRVGAGKGSGYSIHLTTGTPLELRLEMDSPDIFQSEAWLLATAEAFCYTMAFTADDNLPDNEEMESVPFWLTDGIAQMLIPSTQQEELLHITRLAAQKKVTPTASTLTGKNSPEQDPILRRWQQAYDLLLVRASLSEKKHRERLRSWLLSSILGQKPGSFWMEPAEAEKWWVIENRRSSEETTEVVYSLEKSRCELARISPALLTDPKTGELRLYPFAQWFEAKRDTTMMTVAQEKIHDLQTLQLRSSPNYRPAVDAYINAAQLLMDKKKAQGFPKAAAMAQDTVTRLEQRIKDIEKFVDWYLATQQPADPRNDFANYFLWLSSEK